MNKVYNNQANMGGVYQIRNLVNGKVYIGSTKCFKVRAAQHEKRLNKAQHHNKHLMLSWSKYGSENFVFEVLELVLGDETSRKEIEQKHIDSMLPEWTMCYNISKHTCGVSPTLETRLSMSESLKRRWEKPGEKEKQSKLMLDRWQNEVFREKQSNSLRKRWSNEEVREKQSRAQLKFWSKQDISYKENNIQRMLSKRSDVISDDHKRKIKETSRKKFLDRNPETFLCISQEKIDSSRARTCDTRSKKIQIVNLITDQTIICDSIGMASRILDTKTCSLMNVLNGSREHYKYWSCSIINMI